MRFTALIPLACAITSFVLALFCILAGSTPGYMENYHIVALNTSTLGHNLLNATKPPSTSDPNTIGGYLSGLAENITAAIESDLTPIENHLADELAAKLGIKQWYSVHMMDLCEGIFSPNATSPDAFYNVSACSNKTAMYHIDIAETINNELKLGGLHLNLTNIQWPQELTDGIAAINILINVTFVLYCISCGLCGLAIIFSLVTFFLPSAHHLSATNHHYHSSLVSFLGAAATILAFLALGIGSAIITVFAVKATNVINQYGNTIGVYAYKGNQFMAITWAATGVMLVAILAWCVEACCRRRVKRREYSEKPLAPTGGSRWRRRY